jgi:hypothetical protein
MQSSVINLCPSLLLYCWPLSADSWCLRQKISKSLTLIRLIIAILYTGSQGTIVRIVTCYGLDNLGIEIWGREDSVTIQIGPKAHPASSTLDTRTLSWEKSSQGMMLTTHTLLVPRLCMGMLQDNIYLFLYTPNTKNLLRFSLYKFSPSGLF